jgi:hypothetical protein
MGNTESSTDCSTDRYSVLIDMDSFLNDMDII